MQSNSMQLNSMESSRFRLGVMGQYRDHGEGNKIGTNAHCSALLCSHSATDVFE